MVLTTFPDAAVAQRIVRELVEARVIACGNIIPGLLSVYRWQGAVEESNEVLAVLKCSSNVRDRCQQELLSRHPYEVPEIVFLEPAAVLPAYGRWVEESSTARLL